MIMCSHATDIFQGSVENLTTIPEFDAEHNEGTPVYIPALPDPTHSQAVVDVLCGEHLRENDGINAQSLQELL
jgi:hypothetical protein